MSSLSDSDGNRAQNEHGNCAEPKDSSAQGLRIDRLIVARFVCQLFSFAINSLLITQQLCFVSSYFLRGYDNIHNVEIISVPLQSHSHVIEGSVIRYTGERFVARIASNAKI